MKICPQCRTAYPDRGVPTCTRDGTRLVDARAFAEGQGDPLIGVTVAGRFKIVERIGVGGMGTVYRAEQAGLSRAVALKILRKELVFDRDTVTRFHREAKATSLLVHANTVRVFDFGETEDGLLYLAMELLEGELLTARIEREGAIDVRDAVSLIRQVLGSLAEAHSKGIIHRDLKPDNIFLARVEGHATPIVKVLDFGIAKVIQGDRMLDQLETQAGTVFGTPRYMSPEQAQGKTLDPRSDLYSVGILLYQVLTGRPPFVDEDAVVVMAKHIRERPDRPRDVAPDRPIPASLERVVLRAIEKDANKRFTTADELDRKLEATLPEIDSLAAAYRAGKRPTIPRVAIAAAGGLIAVAVAASVYLVASSGSASGVSVPITASSPPMRMEAPSRVLVVSEPTGAAVLSGGEEIGHAPLSVTIPAGSSTVRVELRMQGFASVTADLAATERERRIALPPTPITNVAGTITAQLPVADTAPTPPQPAAQVATSHTGRPRNGRRNNAEARGGAGAGATATPPTTSAPPPTTSTSPPHTEPYERFD